MNVILDFICIELLSGEERDTSEKNINENMFQRESEYQQVTVTFQSRCHNYFLIQ